MDGKNSANCMNLRLLVNKETGRILYAEAGKDFVDLLFSFLILPTGSVIKLLSACGRPKKVACITNLYSSVEKLQTVFMNADKSHLLEPKVISPHSCEVLRIKSSPDSTIYYVCNSLKAPSSSHFSGISLPAPSSSYNGIHNISTQSGVVCGCGQSISCQVQMQKPSQEDTNEVRGMGRYPTNITAKSESESGSGSSGVGYVKETVTFIITDELEISPASTITSITLLNKLNVMNLTNLEERTATVGPAEALELLGASLVSTTALNDVFGPRCCPNPGQSVKPVVPPAPSNPEGEHKPSLVSTTALNDVFGPRCCPNPGQSVKPVVPPAPSNPQGEHKPSDVIWRITDYGEDFKSDGDEPDGEDEPRDFLL